MQPTPPSPHANDSMTTPFPPALAAHTHTHTHTQTVGVDVVDKVCGFAALRGDSLYEVC